MNIVFFGSDDFAAAHLETLLSSPYHIAGCVTQPDRPRDRGMKVVVSPLKAMAENHGVPVLQPVDLKDEKFVSILRDLAADLFIVIAYGRFLPDALLTMPRLGAVNVHGSLLPKYRGAAPINWAIINGENETGISIIRMAARMDSGPVLASMKIPIRPDETSVSLRERMKQEGPQFLLALIERLADGVCEECKQNEADVTFAPKLTKETGRIDWDMPATAIERMVRGLQPWPCAYTFLNGKILKFLKCAVVDDLAGRPGEIISVNKHHFVIGTGQGGLAIFELLPESSRQMDAASFLRGYHLSAGEILPS